MSALYYFFVFCWYQARVVYLGDDGVDDVDKGNDARHEGLSPFS